MKIHITFIIIVLGILQTFSQEEKKTLEVLFLGSSYFNFDDLPNLVEDLASNSCKEIYQDSYMPSGLYLSDHADRSYTLAKINERNWDYIVLQGVGTVTAYPNIFTEHPVYPALVTLKEKILNNDANTKIIFCMPWAFEDGMTWLEGWDDTYSDMQDYIYLNTLNYSNQIDFMIAPVGWAWYSILKELNYPIHYLHLSDWNHPSIRGSYLMACVIYVSIFQESCLGNSYNPGIPESELILFQKTASDIVLDDLDLWNIDEIVLSINNKNIDAFHSNSLNVPNPFNSFTKIYYEVSEDTFVTVSIFNNLGERITQLVNEYQTPGKYSTDFGGKNLAGGIYYYTIQFGDAIITKKMIKIN